MNIKIAGHREAVYRLKDDPVDTIMISSPKNFFRVASSAAIPTFAKSCLQLAFDDLDFPRPGYVLCNKDHLQQAFDFAKGKDEILVTCAVGVSRSSAVAYVLACVADSPREALKILDPGVHDPNLLIVKLGAEMLKKPEMVEEILKWKNLG